MLRVLPLVRMPGLQDDEAGKVNAGPMDQRAEMYQLNVSKAGAFLKVIPVPLIFIRNNNMRNRMFPSIPSRK